MDVILPQIDSQNIVIITGSWFYWKRHFTAILLPENSDSIIKLSRFRKSFAVSHNIEEIENGLKKYHCRKFKASRRNTGKCFVRFEDNVCKAYEIIDGTEVEIQGFLMTFDERYISWEGHLDKALKCSQIVGNISPSVTP